MDAFTLEYWFDLFRQNFIGFTSLFSPFDLEHEQSRQVILEEKCGCRFIRINLDAADFNINIVINLVYMRIIKSRNESTKKSLIDDPSKRLLELQFKSSHSIKSKRLKWIVQKILPTV